MFVLDRHELDKYKMALEDFQDEKHNFLLKIDKLQKEMKRMRSQAEKDQIGSNQIIADLRAKVDKVHKVCVMVTLVWILF